MPCHQAYETEQKSTIMNEYFPVDTAKYGGTFNVWDFKAPRPKAIAMVLDITRFLPSRRMAHAVV